MDKDHRYGYGRLHVKRWIWMDGLYGYLQYGLTCAWQRWIWIIDLDGVYSWIIDIDNG